MQDLHDLSPFGNLVVSSLGKKASMVPGMMIYFLYVLLLMSDNWRFKQALGDIFGLMFTSINEVIVLSLASFGLSIPSFIPGGAPVWGMTLWLK
jgi:hypothetical protein